MSSEQDYIDDQQDLIRVIEHKAKKLYDEPKDEVEVEKEVLKYLILLQTYIAKEGVS